MKFTDKSRFWVIFDTCTLPAYYQDVHNLLALPRGAVLRYEYRGKYLSPLAVKAASEPRSAPSTILLVYAQWKEYRKGGEGPPSSVQSADMVWIATRTAEMLLIPPQEGDNFFFDFKVRGYPKPNESALMAVLNPLITVHDVPFDRWVSISDNLPALDALSEGRDDRNWQSIVDVFGIPPIQFSGDAFWRLTGPYSSVGGGLIQPTYQVHRQKENGEVQVRGITSFYSVAEKSTCSVEVISHTPPLSPEQHSRPASGRHSLEIQMEKDGPLVPACETSLDLRQYTARQIIIAAKGSEEVDETVSVVSFRTDVETDLWPTGPNLTLRFSIAKESWRIVATIIAGVMAFVAALSVPKLWDKDPILAIILALVAGLLTVTTGLLYRGTLSFRL